MLVRQESQAQAFDAEEHLRKLREKDRAKLHAAIDSVLFHAPSNPTELIEFLGAEGYEIRPIHRPLNLVGVDMENGGRFFDDDRY